jgi:hypothetical protein
MGFNAQQIMHLQQLGVTVYVPRARIAQPASLAKATAEAPVRMPAAVQAATINSTALLDGEEVLQLAQPARRAAAFVARAQSPELVVPSAEHKAFSNSKLSLHLGLALHGRALPIVEHAVQSETALWLDDPRGALKLSSISLLRSNWRSKRQLWLAIRLWRKRTPRAP